MCYNSASSSAAKANEWQISSQLLSRMCTTSGVSGALDATDMLKLLFEHKPVGIES